MRASRASLSVLKRLSFPGLVLLAAPVGAVDHVWLIGGGPGPSGSQAQIEYNVAWVRDVLRAKPVPPQLHVYFTDGGERGKDVKQWVKSPEGREFLTPLARVFGQPRANGETYRNHRLGKVDGGTQADTLKQRLTQDFAQVAGDDRVLVVYNGHGLGDERDAAGNTLRLWKDTRLTVREMDGLLSHLPPSAPVRFIFTQCYSGGFARLIRPQAQDAAALGPTNRCGFLAESETRESEGCSDGINTGDYRDYTTYLFAAINGRTRLGGAIQGKPDLDGNGEVSLYEAHLYALREAHNADLPRSTSEVYLERWQPWYLRWLDTGAEPENVYGEIAAEVARRLKLPPSGRPLIAALTAGRGELKQRLAENEREQAVLREEIAALQKKVRRDVMLIWPEAGQPYTLGFARFLSQDVGAAQDFIVQHARYSELVERQERLERLDLQKLEDERDASQLDKIVRLRTLARLKAQFERHASAAERGEYERLLGCERTVP